MGQGRNRHAHLFQSAGYWARHARKVVRVIWGRSVGSEVAASPLRLAMERAGVGQGRRTADAG